MTAASVKAANAFSISALTESNNPTGSVRGSPGKSSAGPSGASLRSAANSSSDPSTSAAGRAADETSDAAGRTTAESPPTSTIVTRARSSGRDRRDNRRESKDEDAMDTDTAEPASSPPSSAAASTGKRSKNKPPKIFQCSGYGNCKMTFTRSEHLARHIRKHTGERPFKCHCQRTFSRLDNLRQHAHTVHANEAIVPTTFPYHPRSASLSALPSRHQSYMRPSQGPHSAVPEGYAQAPPQAAVAVGPEPSSLPPPSSSLSFTTRSFRPKHRPNPLDLHQTRYGAGTDSPPVSPASGSALYTPSPYGYTPTSSRFQGQGMQPVLPSPTSLVSPAHQPPAYQQQAYGGYGHQYPPSQYSPYPPHMQNGPPSAGPGGPPPPMAQANMPPGPGRPYGDHESPVLSRFPSTNFTPPSSATFAPSDQGAVASPEEGKPAGPERGPEKRRTWGPGMFNLPPPVQQANGRAPGAGQQQTPLPSASTLLSSGNTPPSASSTTSSISSQSSQTSGPPPVYDPYKQQQAGQPGYRYSVSQYGDQPPPPGQYPPPPPPNGYYYGGQGPPPQLAPPGQPGPAAGPPGRGYYYGSSPSYTYRRKSLSDMKQEELPYGGPRPDSGPMDESADDYPPTLAPLRNVDDKKDARGLEMGGVDALLEAANTMAHMATPQ
ncbi:uncharacterized protein V1510DRAFT_419531 [Dipodascopsis tothii]|uniref:uncharacterized protein n=1 Tax=Dipodascopsis tothii TaxID=44089 RepID=UPI0034CF553E